MCFSAIVLPGCLVLGERVIRIVDFDHVDACERLVVQNVVAIQVSQAASTAGGRKRCGENPMHACVPVTKPEPPNMLCSAYSAVWTYNPNRRVWGSYHR